MLTTSTKEPAADGLGPWIRQWRHNHRWTQEQLAEALGYEVSYIAKIERGRRRPSRQFIARLATVAEVDQEQLMQASRQPTERLRLPLPKTELMGRDREIGEVARLLRTERCVTLVGAPGIGKTSLALEVAWRVADDFRHGGRFVALADVPSADSVASTLVHGLGLVEPGVTDVDDLLLQALRDKHVLLVLDNFEHLLTARALIRRLLDAAPKLHMLATSREALGLRNERAYAVRPLAFPDPGGAVPDDLNDYPAVSVFVARSRLVRNDFVVDDTNASSVIEICARLAGVPLAIALTARASRILSPSDIARSLRARSELFTDPGDEPGIHERLDTALDWSWARLPEVQQALLANLSVFSGGCSLAAVEAVCSGAGEDVLPALAALERKSLIEPTQSTNGDSRFLCLEPIRRYALQKLEERGLMANARRRHCDYFLALAEESESKMTAGDDQSRALQQLEAEHANLAAAFEWALHHAPERALLLGAALWRFYSMRRISEGRRWLSLALAGSAGPSLVRARVLTGFAILVRAQGELSIAEVSLAEACSLATEHGSLRELAFARLTQGIVAEDQAQYDSAERRFLEATDLYRQIGEERGVGHGLNCLGVVALRRGDVAAAAAQFHAALGRFRQLKDAWSVAVTATNLGWIAEQANEYGEAAGWYEESRQIWQGAGDEHGRGRSLVSLGRVARRQRNFATARNLLEEALGVFHRVGDRRLAAACLGELADVAYERRRWDMAARLLGAAEAIRASLGTPAWAEEAALENHVRGAVGDDAGAAAANRAFTTGGALTLEDVVEMVEADAWPPPGRKQRVARRSDPFATVPAASP